MIKVGFFGTPDLAKKVLEGLYLSDDFLVEFVVTSVDKPTGRSQKITPSPVKYFAQKNNIKIFQPEKIKGNIDFINELKNIDVDYFVVIAYGKILPKEILEIPKKQCVNIHGSILPLYRGASPIQSTLINGELVTGITLISMNEKMDEGDIIDIKKIDIDKFETAETLFKKFEEESPKFLIETLKEDYKGNRGLLPQLNEFATYCSKIEKKDGEIKFSKSAQNIFNLWRGLTPWPGIYTFFEGKKLIITKCDYIEEFDLSDELKLKKIGEVVVGDFGTGVRCSFGILILNEVKIEGKKAVNIKDFVNGKKSFIGSII